MLQKIILILVFCFSVSVYGENKKTDVTNNVTSQKYFKTIIQSLKSTLGDRIDLNVSEYNYSDQAPRSINHLRLTIRSVSILQTDYG